MAIEKPRVFWFHYNKPESKKQNKNILTIHYKKQCHLVNDIECFVPIKVKHRNSQPYCVIHGKGYVNITNNKATIKNSI